MTLIKRTFILPHYCLLAMVSFSMIQAKGQSPVPAQLPNYPESDAFAYNIAQASGFTKGPFTFHLNSPDAVTLLSAQPGSSYLYAGTWIDGTWYAADQFASGSRVYTVNITNGSRTLVGTTYAYINDLAYDWSTTNLYAVCRPVGAFDCQLYRVNPSNGFGIPVVTLSKQADGLACDVSGTLYTVNMEDDFLYKINKSTGTMTPVGYLGVNVYNNVNLEYDNSDSSLYMISFMYPYTKLFRVNTATGLASLAGSFPAQADVRGLAIPNNQPSYVANDAGIISINSPVNGVLLNNSEQVSVTVMNFSPNALSMVPVNYQINDGPVRTAFFNDNLPPHSMATFVFPQVEDLRQPYNFHIRAWTSYASDPNSANDSCFITVSGYCQAGSKLQEAYISRVIMGVVDNISGASVTGYGDFTQISYSLNIGDELTIWAYNGPAPSPDDQLAVWVDWNRNGDFMDDPAPVVVLGPDSFLTTFSVPPGTASGLTRMRIGLVRGWSNSPCGIAENGEFEDYLVNVVLDSNDVGLSTIINPVSSHYLGNAEVVRVRLFNNGSEPQAFFPVKYQVDSNSIVIQDFPGILQPQEDTLFAFTQTADFSEHGRDYFLKVWTDLITDEISNNDTVADTVRNLYGIYCAAFNTVQDSWIDTVKIGDTMHVSQNSPNGYGDYTDFHVPVIRGQGKEIRVYQVNNPAIYDACRTWIDWNMNGDFEDSEMLTMPQNWNGYWSDIMVPPANANLGTTRLRTRLSGDQIPPPCGETLMGETEDYTIEIYAVQNDLGVSLISSPLTDINLSDHEVVELTVSNYGSSPQTNFIVNYQVEAGTVVSDTFPGTLSPGSSADFSFSQTVDLSADSSEWNIRCWTSLTSDENHQNDTSFTWVSNLPVNYCAAAAEQCDEYIARVLVGDIDNISSCNTSGYSDFTNLSTQVKTGDTLYVEIYNDSIYNYSDDVCGIWIDWNSNGDFYDDEWPEVFGGPYIFWAFPVVPQDAILGTVRFRTRITFDEIPDPCGISYYGEVEDYNLMISEGGGNQTATLHGTVEYLNLSGTALQDVSIALVLGQDTIAETLTTANGSYFFNEVPLGQYALKVSCNKPWGGVNAVDGLLILRHFTEISMLSGLKREAADVDNSTFINAIDALLAVKRFVEVISSFPKGDWIFDVPEVNVFSPGDHIVNLMGLCVGDVDGSHVP